MKKLQYVATFSLIAALTGLSPVVAAEEGTPSSRERIKPCEQQFESTQRYELSPARLDEVRAGSLFSDLALKGWREATTRPAITVEQNIKNKVDLL